MKTMLELGQIVYYIKSEIKDIEEICSYCEGTGELELKNGKKLTCPKCDKNKEYKHKKVYHICRFCVNGIAIKKEYLEDYFELYPIKIIYYADINKQYPCYDFMEKDNCIYDSEGNKVEIFFNIEDAQKECDKRETEELLKMSKNINKKILQNAIDHTINQLNIKFFGVPTCYMFRVKETVYELLWDYIPRTKKSLFNDLIENKDFITFDKNICSFKINLPIDKFI